MIKELAQDSILEFQKTVGLLFRKDLVFALICGSLARGEGNKHSDADMLIAVNKVNDRLLERFREWYLTFHLKLGLVPDSTYLGEVVLIDSLDQALAAAKKHIPVRVIDKEQIYDGIVWAGMLVGETIGFVGDMKAYNKYRNEAEIICQKWRQSLLTSESPSLRQEVALKNIITYQP